MVLCWRALFAAVVAAVLVLAPRVHAQETQPTGSAPAEGESAAAPPEEAASQAADEDDTSLDPAEPDFNLVNLPTGLNLPRFKSAFRVTHRFARPLGQGDFGDLVDDLFGFDGGAQIGLEYRFGVARNAQLGIYRTSDKTIQFFGQYAVIDQSDTMPVGVAALVSVEGQRNFRDQYSPAIGAVVSRKFGERGAIYVEPIWVGNTNENLVAPDTADDEHTFLIGLGGRVGIREGLYLLLEVAPRLVGHDPGDEHVSFGLESQVGGHVFQINFSNGTGSTRGQIARGGTEDWFIGFNISRKFW
jgi:hypothetical protein